MKVTISAKTDDGKIAVKDLKTGQMFSHAPNNDIMLIASYAYENGVDKIAVSFATGEAGPISGEWMIDERELLNDVRVTFEP